MSHTITRFGTFELSAVSTVQRKPTTSLASYDIELLKVWYGVLRDSAGRLHIRPSACRADISEGPEPPPQLVVFLHGFEQFDESVVQDLFFICRWATNPLLYFSPKRVISPYVPQLPLIVVVVLSSLYPSFLQTTYPQPVLSLLRVDTFTVPSGPTLLERIIAEVGDV